MVDTVIFLTSGTTHVIPLDFNPAANTVAAIGAGNRSLGGASIRPGQGAGGGGFAQSSNLTPSSGTVQIQIGANSGISGTTGASWWDGTALGSGTCQVGACGGFTGTGVSVNGGTAATCVGTTTFSGGNGGTIVSGNTNGGSGGGGAGGPNGNGVAGSNAAAGGAAAVGGAGDAGSGGAGGAAATTTVAGQPGGAGTTWTSNPGGASAGPGGGGGGGRGGVGTPGFIGGNGGLYGGGAGGPGCNGASVGPQSDGAQGIIVVTYTPLSGNTGGLFLFF